MILHVITPSNENRRGKKSLLRKGVCRERFLQIAIQAAKMHLLQTRLSRAELQQRHREILASMTQAGHEAYLAQMAGNRASISSPNFVHSRRDQTGLAQARSGLFCCAKHAREKAYRYRRERKQWFSQMAAELLSLAQHLFCVRFSQYLGYIMFRLSKAFLHTFKAFVRVFFAVTSGG